MAPRSRHRHRRLLLLSLLAIILTGRWPAGTRAHFKPAPTASADYHCTTQTSTAEQRCSDDITTTSSHLADTTESKPEENHFTGSRTQPRSVEDTAAEEEAAWAAAATMTETALRPGQHNAAVGTNAPPPIHPFAARERAGKGSTDKGKMRLQHLGRILSNLGYEEMASAAPLVEDSSALAVWTGPLTIFAVPDEAVFSECPTCSRRQLLLEQMVGGIYPYATLVSAAPHLRLRTASSRVCLALAASPVVAPGKAKLLVDGVEVTRPQIYDDGFYIIHGLRGLVLPLTRAPCSNNSAMRKTATGGATERKTMREALVRLRDAGYGFVALALRHHGAEMEQAGNVTVFALSDKSLFKDGEHRVYVKTFLVHIVPGRRLTHQDLLLLEPGTLLPTLAGSGHDIVVTHGAGREGVGRARLNYVPLEKPDAVINSRVAVHMVPMPLPALWTSEKIAVKTTSPQFQRSKNRVPFYATGVGIAAVLVCAGVIFLAMMAIKGRRTLVKSRTHCNMCFFEPIQWMPRCCRIGYCSRCLSAAMVRRHVSAWSGEPRSELFCTRRRPAGVIDEIGDVGTFLNGDLPARVIGFEREEYPPWYLYQVEEYADGEMEGFVLWFNNILDCRSRTWPRRRKVIYRHLGADRVERVGEQDMPPVVETYY